MRGAFRTVLYVSDGTDAVVRVYGYGGRVHNVVTETACGAVLKLEYRWYVMQYGGQATGGGSVASKHMKAIDMVSCRPELTTFALRATRRACVRASERAASGRKRSVVWCGVS